MLTSQIPRLNRKKWQIIYLNKNRKLFGQYESYVALTRTSISMRRQKLDLVAGFLPTGGIDINERIKNKSSSKALCSTTVGTRSLLCIGF